MGWIRLRTVRLEDRVAKVVDIATQQYPRFNDAFEGLEWLLARSPDRGAHSIKDGVKWHVYQQNSDPLAKTPIIQVLYQFNDQEVQIYGIEVLPYEAEDAE